MAALHIKRITAAWAIAAMLAVCLSSVGLSAAEGIYPHEHYRACSEESQSLMKPGGDANNGVQSGTDCALRNVPAPHDFVWNGTIPSAPSAIGTDKPGRGFVVHICAKTAFSSFLSNIQRRAP